MDFHFYLDTACVFVPLLYRKLVGINLWGSADIQTDLEPDPPADPVRWFTSWIFHGWTGCHE